jgi:hypothetical protein
MLNPKPVTFAADTTMPAVPLLDSVRLRELEVPTVTFPNAIDVGETVRVFVGAATPVPEKETTVGEPLRLLAMDAEPFTVPTACGWKTTFAVYVLPEATVRGNVMPLTLKPAPVTLIEETTKSAVPVFVTATVFVPLAPTVTLPNDNEFGVTVADIVVLPDC